MVLAFVIFKFNVQAVLNSHLHLYTASGVDIVVCKESVGLPVGKIYMCDTGSMKLARADVVHPRRTNKQSP